MKGEEYGYRGRALSGFQRGVVECVDHIASVRQIVTRLDIVHDEQSKFMFINILRSQFVRYEVDSNSDVISSSQQCQLRACLINLSPFSRSIKHQRSEQLYARAPWYKSWRQTNNPSILICGKVHADSSNFASGVSKQEAYEQILEQAKALFEDQRNWVSTTRELKTKIHHQKLPSRK